MPDYSSVIDPTAPRDQYVNAIAEHNPSILSSSQIPSTNIKQNGGYSYGFSNNQSLPGNNIPDYVVEKNPALISDSNLNASKLVGGRRHRRKTNRGRKLNRSIKSRRHRRSNIRHVKFNFSNKNRMSKKRNMKSKLFSKIIGGKKKSRRSRRSRKMKGGNGYTFNLSSQIAGMPVLQQYNSCKTN